MRDGFRAPAGARAEARRASRAGTIDAHLARLVASGRPITLEQARTVATVGTRTAAWVDRLEARAVTLDLPGYIRTAAKRGVDAHRDELSGAGLVNKTLREAADMARGHITPDKVIRANAWQARHAIDLRAPANNDPNDPGFPGPGAVAHLLWGIDPLDPDPARKWFAAKAEAIKNDRNGDLMAAETRAANPADLPDELAELLATVVAFYLRAHSAHVNVRGGMFIPWHQLFEMIYADTVESVDPLAENLRKIGQPAPLRLDQIVALRGVDLTADPGQDPLALAADLRDASDELIDQISEAFDCATACGQQGIANFLAERMDAHQKWRWQLSAALGQEVPADTLIIEPVEDDPVLEDEPTDPADDLAEDLEEVTMPRNAELADIEARRGLIEKADKVTFTSELRADDTSSTIRGYAVRWNTEADGLSFREQFAPGAFTRSLASGTPVFLLVNHDADMVPLASTKSGTLRLRQDDLGLAIEADLDPANPRAQELLSALKRGDIDKMSFAFSVDPDGQTRSEGLRTVTSASLYECSVVTWPAYSATSVGMRTAEDLDRRRRRLSLLMAD